MHNKKIAIWGWGREGKSAAKFLQKHNCNFTLLNDTFLDLQDTPQNLQAVIIGEKITNAISQFDMVIKSPGVSLYRDEIQNNQHVCFTSVTNLWFEFIGSNHKTIAVTGTKGKSTTASLLAHVLTQEGFSTSLSGNIGLPIFEAPDSEYYVLELSSYQIADLKYSAKINVLLNLYPEHLDWHGNVERYFHDKTKIFRYTHNYNVVHSSCANYPLNSSIIYDQHSHLHARADGIYNGTSKLVDKKNISLRGIHNYRNICAVLAVCQQLKIPLGNVVPHLRSFCPLPHRLQKVVECQGIHFISDSISTTPQSTIAAIETFKEQPITLLVGGQNRGLDWEKFARQLQQYPLNFIITMYESGKKLHDLLQQNQYQQTSYLCNFEQAITKALQVTPTNGVVLLSPAAPSYDTYKNYIDKGEHYIETVMRLTSNL